MPFGHFRSIKEFSKTPSPLFNKKWSLQKSGQWFRLFISHNFDNFDAVANLAHPSGVALLQIAVNSLFDLMRP